jgi:hypothetical protein
MKIEILICTHNKSRQEVIEIAQKSHAVNHFLVADEVPGPESSEEIALGDVSSFTFFSTNKVGANAKRNFLFDASTADVVMFGDDDICLQEGYESSVQKAFSESPNADAIRFNCASLNPDRPLKLINVERKITRKDVMSLPASGFFFRRSAIEKLHLRFDESIGPGTKVDHGDDTVFLYNCICKGMIIKQIPKTLVTVEQSSSTWSSHSLEDKCYSHGVIYWKLFKKKANLYAVFHLLKHMKIYHEIGFSKAWKSMRKGINSAKLNGKDKAN